MVTKDLPTGKYMVFRFKGLMMDSLEPLAEYIHRERHLQYACRLKENARFDFMRYGTAVDSSGSSDITTGCQPCSRIREKPNAPGRNPKSVYKRPMLMHGVFALRVRMKAGAASAG